MKALEIVIAGLAAFFLLGVVAGVVLVIAVSAVRTYREVRRRQEWRRRQELHEMQQWQYGPGEAGWPDPWPGPSVPQDVDEDSSRLPPAPPVPPAPHDQDNRPPPWPGP